MINSDYERDERDERVSKKVIIMLWQLYQLADQCRDNNKLYELSPGSQEW